MHADSLSEDDHSSPLLDILGADAVSNVISSIPTKEERGIFSESIFRPEQLQEQQ